MDRTIVIGAVAYNPRVVPIWEAMRDYFRATGPAIDYVLFSNYERQVQALLDRHINIAWNTNLAWVKARRRSGGACKALALRDTDVNFTSVFIASDDSGVKTLADMHGKRLALGSADSAQAAILPIHFLQQAGVDPLRACQLLRFDVDGGKHGDTGSSETSVLRALQNGQADVGAMATTSWNAAQAEPSSSALRCIWTSPGYCHCNFTALADFPAEAADHWTASLLRMSYDEPRWRTLMDQEGLKRWIPADPGVLEGYRLLFDAVEMQGIV